MQSKLTRRLDEADKYLSGFLQRSTPLLSSPQDFYELEGWLSDVWQIWCRFCRNAIMASCGGCRTLSGAAVPQNHPSWEIVSDIACRQSKGVAPRTIGSNALLHREPTWGHIDKLIDVIQALAPANSAQLLAGFGTVPAIEHIRLIRNAAAHRNQQSLASVVAFRSQYRGGRIRHPLEALFWLDAATGRTLVHSRLDDMRVAAANAFA